MLENIYIKDSYFAASHGVGSVSLNLNLKVTSAIKR